MSVAMNSTVDVVLPALSDPERLAALRDSGLQSGGDPTMDRLARLASALLDAPRAFVTLVTPDQQHLPGMVRHDAPADTSRVTPLSDSMCQFAIATDDVLVIPDGSEDRLVQNLPPVRRGEIGAYAGVPLRTGRGHVFGTLCVVDGSPRSWDTARLSLLEDLTALAAQEVEQRLTLAQGERLRRVVHQMAQQVPLLADAVASLVAIADEHDEPRLQRYSALTRSRMEPVLSLTGELEAASSEPAHQVRTDPGHVDLRAIASNSVRSARAATGSDTIRLDLGNAPLLVRCDGLDLERSFTHVIVTALHHSRGTAPVVLQLAGPTAGGAHGASGRGGTGVGTLTVRADDCRVPTSELARIVSRFQQVSCAAGSARDREERAAIRVVRGTVTAETGSVRGQCSRDGELRLEASWQLDGAPEVVSSS
ncbi:GAF domain-containing protein [Modestobacter sp. URMC 112]